MTAYDFGLNPQLEVAVEPVGREREPVMLIDDVARDPRALVDCAAAEARFEPAWTPVGGYPGLRAPAPLAYVDALSRRLAPMIQAAFALPPVKVERAECSFSIVTLRPEALTPLQRIPHADTADPLQFAILHFLCGAEHGGTAFYRHRATGFETLSAERGPAYREARRRELAAAPPGYICGDDGAYEQIAAYGARFNRLLVYRSRVLHSGRIPAGAPLSPDPRRGRLTANVFLNFRLLQPAA